MEKTVHDTASERIAFPAPAVSDRHHVDMPVQNERRAATGRALAPLTHQDRPLDGKSVIAVCGMAHDLLPLGDPAVNVEALFSPAPLQKLLSRGLVTGDAGAAHKLLRQVKQLITQRLDAAFYVG